MLRLREGANKAKRKAEKYRASANAMEAARKTKVSACVCELSMYGGAYNFPPGFSV